MSLTTIVVTGAAIALAAAIVTALIIGHWLAETMAQVLAFGLLVFVIVSLLAIVIPMASYPKQTGIDLQSNATYYCHVAQGEPPDVR